MPPPRSRPTNSIGLTALICCVLFLLAAILSPQLRSHMFQPQDSSSYSIRILSYDPLMIYIINFVPKDERVHLLQTGANIFKRSEVGIADDLVVSSDRTSSTASLHKLDPIVQRIMSRASAFQGYTSLQDHETLQMTRYSEGQEYKPHWDHIQNEPVPWNGTQRMTTFFAILEATCDTCGTRFPDLKIDWSQEDPRWCEYVDCSDHDGITVRPIPGNALFWKNLDNSGAGDVRTLHAGLPPVKGVKTGLNIWTHTPKVPAQQD